MRDGYLPRLGELQAFCACVKAGTTRGAGEELNLTQSAVSRSLATLEERLGVRLFNRVRQQLHLSDAGHAFHPQAERLLSQLKQSAITVMAFGGRSDLVRLAVLPSVGTAWLVPRLVKFRAAHPDITLDILSRLEPVDFETDPFDAALQRRDLRGAAMHCDPLMPERLIVVASPALVGAPLPDAAIARLPLLQQATRPSLWLDWFRDVDIDPRSILRGDRFEHFGMLVAAAIAGLGVAVVPELVVAHDLAAGRLRRASVRHLDSASGYCLFYPEGRASNPAFQAFRSWITAEAATTDHAPAP